MNEQIKAGTWCANYGSSWCADFDCCDDCPARERVSSTPPLFQGRKDQLVELLANIDLDSGVDEGCMLVGRFLNVNLLGEIADQIMELFQNYDPDEGLELRPEIEAKLKAGRKPVTPEALFQGDKEQPLEQEQDEFLVEAGIMEQGTVQEDKNDIYNITADDRQSAYDRDVSQFLPQKDKEGSYSGVYECSKCGKSFRVWERAEFVEHQKACNQGGKEGQLSEVLKILNKNRCQDGCDCDFPQMSREIITLIQRSIAQAHQSGYQEAIETVKKLLQTKSRIYMEEARRIPSSEFSDDYPRLTAKSDLCDDLLAELEEEDE